MYEYIKGELTYIGENYVVIEANGIGYKITTSSDNLKGKGERVTFYTYLYVKEDIFELYGFPTMEQKSAFELLISVSGVGPKAAISILSVLSPNNLTVAVVTNNPKAISAAQGVGPKLAQRIILELKDKVSTKTSFAVDENPSSSASAENEAVTALTALGYSFNDAVTAVSKAPKDLSVEDTIKFALKQFI